VRHLNEVQDRAIDADERTEGHHHREEQKCRERRDAAS